MIIKFTSRHVYFKYFSCTYKTDSKFKIRQWIFSIQTKEVVNHHTLEMRYSPRHKIKTYMQTLTKVKKLYNFKNVQTGFFLIEIIIKMFKITMKKCELNFKLIEQ